MTDRAVSDETSSLGAGLNRWLGAKHRFITYAFCFFLGISFASAFAPTNMAPLAFVVFPLLILMVDGAKSHKSAFVRGWAFGVGFFIAGLFWIGNSFAQQSAVPPALAPIAVVLLAMVLALYPGLALALSKRYWTSGWMRVLIFTFFWMLTEYGRSVLFTGFPWHVTASIWANWLTILQSIAWLGTHGLSLLTVLMASSVILFFDGSKGLASRLLPGSMLAIFIAMITLGAFNLAMAETRFYEGINLRLVQANISQKEKWLSHLIADHFDQHIRLSRGGSAAGTAENVDVLIWPETSVQSYYFDREGSVERWRLSRLLEPGGYAITGVPRYQLAAEEAENGKDVAGQGSQAVSYYNSLMALDRDGNMVGRYDKHHLVPFGEYLPFNNLLTSLGIKSLNGSTGFTSGTGPITMRLPGLPAFSPTICYEAIFPGGVIDTNDPPKWILNVTNDAWFGQSDGPYQHLALAVMRAVEERMSVVRSAGSGISAVIDPYGRIVRSLGVNRQGVINSPLPKPLDLNVMRVKMKSIIFYLSFVLLGLFILYRRKTKL